MTRHRASVAGLFLVLIGLSLAATGPRLGAAADTLPAKLTDQEFWKLSEELSEPNGQFRSDNLLSNELYFPLVVADLVQRARPEGVYLGVGPEQNFEYMIALRPKMAFITDIRRGNLHAQLMYKALFELSADRAEFISRLFNKARPEGLGPTSTAADLIKAFTPVQAGSQASYEANLKAIDDLLTKTHGLPLSKEDLEGIDHVYGMFYRFGLDITYNSSNPNNGGRGGGGNMTDYASLMVATDPNGMERSYLATDAAFRFLKDFEQRNLLVPLVGNFGGPTALKAVGQYVRAHGAVVSAFYLSNVEQYLRQDGIWENFCANVASMPLDEHSTFIRSGQQGGRGGFGGGGRGLMNSLGPMQDETRACAVASR